MTQHVVIGFVRIWDGKEVEFWKKDVNSISAALSLRDRMRYWVGTEEPSLVHSLRFEAATVWTPDGHEQEFRIERDTEDGNRKRYLVTFKEIRYLTYLVEAVDSDEADEKGEELYVNNEDAWYDLDTDTVGSTVVQWPEGDSIPDKMRRQSIS